MICDMLYDIGHNMVYDICAQMYQKQHVYAGQSMNVKNREIAWLYLLESRTPSFVLGSNGGVQVLKFMFLLLNLGAWPLLRHRRLCQVFWTRFGTSTMELNALQNLSCGLVSTNLRQSTWFCSGHLHFRFEFWLPQTSFNYQVTLSSNLRGELRHTALADFVSLWPEESLLRKDETGILIIWRSARHHGNNPKTRKLASFEIISLQFFLVSLGGLQVS